MKRIMIILICGLLFLQTIASKSFAQKIAIAILDFDSKGQGLGRGVADIVTERVRYEFGRKNGYDIVAREKMTQLAREKAIQLSGCTEVTCAVQIGKALNVRKMVVGSVGKLGKRYLVFIRSVDVEKENVECNDMAEGEVKVEDIPNLVPPIVDRISACLLGEPAIPETTAIHKSVLPLKHLGKNNKGYKVYHNEKDGSRMILIPAGIFTMGSDDGGPGEKPAHRTQLGAYLIDKTEVTVGMFKKFVAATGYRTDAEKMGGAVVLKNDSSDSGWGLEPEATWQNPFFNQSDSSPVVCVSWNDAKAYSEWVGKRLPTEAEWEKAARGDDKRDFPWGNKWDPEKCNVKNNPGLIGKTTQIGSFLNGESPYGLLDMSGNAWEWCSDWLTGPSTGEERVIRGGSWWSESYSECRTWTRKGKPQRYRSSLIGFRCAMNAPD